jgi:hypothetical protein
MHLTYMPIEVSVMPVPVNAQDIPLFDAGSTDIRTDLSAIVVVGKVPLPGGGEIGFATIRLANTTLHIPLDRDGADQWSQVLGQLRDMLSGSGLAVPTAPKGLAIARPGQHG